MSRGVSVCVCLAIVAIARATRADDSPEPLAVAYDAPDGCPTSGDFFREVTSRTTRARAAQPNERARIIHVVVTKRGAEHAGRLWFEEANTSSTARSVSGATCAEVVGALALIGALAVDPRASTAPIAAPVAATPGATTAEPPGAPTTSAPTAPTARASATPAATAERPALTEPPSPRKRSRVEVGAQVEVAFVAGGVPSGRLFGDLSIGPRDGLFAPSLRLSIARSLEVDRSGAVGGATLRYTVAGLDACPVRIAIAGPLAFRPCAGASAGVLDASGTGIVGSVSRSRPWATLSGVGRLVWEPLAWLDVDLEAGVIAPLYRESFVFTPGVALYEAPAAGLLGRAGLGVRFP